MNRALSFIIGLLFTFLLPFLSLFAILEYQKIPNQLKINLIGEINGKGLETDLKVLKKALEQYGCLVKVLALQETKRSHAHINIFLQTLIPKKYAWARINWFIPNPEWYTQDLESLEKIDLILCRTKEIERIFKELNKSTYYLGFTSPDCYQKEIQKNYFHCFHLAGGSFQKGTVPILNLWLASPYLPLLTVIKYPSEFNSTQSNLEWIPYRIPEEQLRILQNQCGIHLCPSETEGFGHYIMEALSTGAIVLTTDAPPMNEFIQDPCCLVPYIQSEPRLLAINYYVDSISLESKIKAVLSLSPEQLNSISLTNRSFYLQKRKEFYEKLGELLWIMAFFFVD